MSVLKDIFVSCDRLISVHVHAKCETLDFSAVKCKLLYAREPSIRPLFGQDIVVVLQRLS